MTVTLHMGPILIVFGIILFGLGIILAATVDERNSPAGGLVVLGILLALIGGAYL